MIGEVFAILIFVMELINLQRIWLVDNKGKLVSIPRFLGEDEDGIIMIGEVFSMEFSLKSDAEFIFPW